MEGIICPHCDEKIELFGKGGVEKAAADFNVPILGEPPMDPKIAEIEDSGKVHTDITEEMLWGKEFASIVDSVERFKK